MISLICARDRQPLVEHASYFACRQCGQQHKIVEGVVCTLEVPDEYYEGAYENQTHFVPRSEMPWHVWPLWLINSGYLWTVRKHVPQGATVLELGCAGGVRYFGKRYRMIGCDLSFASLRILDFYERRVQADAAGCIPVPANSVDAVVSSYFWEHIPPQVKPSILRECRRILKPDGKLVFLYDVETENPLIRKYRAINPQLYTHFFIEGDGHLGYQSADDNLSLFRQAGFEVLMAQGFEKTWLQSPSVYDKLARFGTPAGPRLAWAAALGRAPFFYFYTACVRILDVLLCPFLPNGWSRIAIAVCRKAA